MKLLNILLPFATPGTPLLQDIIHLTALCMLLYFAPQIQQWVEKRRARSTHNEAEDVDDRIPDVEQHDEVVPEGHAEPQDTLAQQDDTWNHNDQRAGGRPREHPADLDDAAENGQPGPATVPPIRNVGAKKAKSLARKDQKRAYNEFMRSQGDAQRARDAQGATEREAALSAERERRALIERDLQSRKAQERGAKKEREEQDRKHIARRTELVLDIVRAELDSKKMCNLFKVAEALGDDVDEDWVERVLKASGMIGRGDDTATVITETGWVVVVTANDMQDVYQAAIEDDLGDGKGRIAQEEVAGLLVRILEQRGD